LRLCLGVGILLRMNALLQVVSISRGVVVRIAGLILLASSALSALGATLYVDADNSTPIPPYNTWNKAATRIQDAIDAASAGDLVWVTNGVYDHLTLSMSRITINKAITVKSVNGPTNTVIRGGLNIRCAWVASNACLSGFTLTNGQTRTTGNRFEDESGGGAWCQPGAVVTNCIVVGCEAAVYGGGVYGGSTYNSIIRQNSAGECGGGIYQGSVYDSTIAENSAMDYGGGVDGSSGDDAVRCVVENNYAEDGGGGTYYGDVHGCTIRGNQSDTEGGGSYGGLLEHCLITGNRAPLGGGSSGSGIRSCFINSNEATEQGGGCYDAHLGNCTVVDNVAGWGGGVSHGNATNCIIYYNYAYGKGDNYDDCPVNDSCTEPDTFTFRYNITNAPGLLSLSNPHLVAGSPCIGVGTNAAWMTNAVDIDGEARMSGSSVDMGLDEFWDSGMTGSLSIALVVPSTQVVANYALRFESIINGRASGYRWDFGDGASQTDLCVVTHAFPTAGVYQVALTAWNHETTNSSTRSIQVVAGYTNYVSLTGSHQSPFADWSHAATSIQAAVSANSYAGGVVLVAPGIYEAGEVLATGSQLNRVAVTNPVIVRSANGPAQTKIMGRSETILVEPVRCVWLGAGAELHGFTLTNGHCRESGHAFQDMSGGGAYGESSALFSNCVISGCSAPGYGGGIIGGRVFDCTIAGNHADLTGGGAYGGELVGCTLQNNAAEDGGGAADAALFFCTLANNTASDDGGGLARATAWQCALHDNVAGNVGGGACDCDLFNCHLYANDADYGGGMDLCAARNCTLVNNSATFAGGAQESTLWNCLLYFDHASYGSEEISLSCELHDCYISIGVPGEITGLQGLRNPHLLPGGACIDQGTNATWMSGAVDVDGEARIRNDHVDVGCDEMYPDRLTGTLHAAIFAVTTNAVTGTPLIFAADIEGRSTGYVWRIDGRRDYTNSLLAACANLAPGYHEVAIEAWNLDTSSAATLTVHVAAGYTNYVDLLGGDEPPYDTWEKAARRIQDAVDACYAGGTVLVTNGLYTLGSTMYYSDVPARVVLVNGIKLKSVNGPANTILRGLGPLGPTAVRCVYMGRYSELHGFALEDGHTLLSSDFYINIRGGGAWCEEDTVLSNCVFRHCAAAFTGGGIFQGELYNCTLEENTAEGSGGAAGKSVLHDCIVSGNTSVVRAGGLEDCEMYGGRLCFNQGRIGGGSAVSTLEGVTVEYNSAENSGGGTYGGSLSDCIVRQNYAGAEGGGVAGSRVYDSMITGNTASTNNAGTGGGAASAQLYGCLVLSNTASSGGGAYASELYTCRVLNNRAISEGGGIRGTYAEDCAFIGNTAYSGGGAKGATLWNCTVIANSAMEGGGIYTCEGGNTIVYYNEAAYRTPNHVECRLDYSCSTPALMGEGNLTGDPGLAGVRNPHLLSNSICRSAGVYAAGMTNRTDIDGDAFGGPGHVDIGCDQFNSTNMKGSLLLAITSRYQTVATGFEMAFTMDSEGYATAHEWQWADGSKTSNQCVSGHSFATAGTYRVVLYARNDDGLSCATVTVQVVDRKTHFVSATGGHVAPFTNWISAATNIQAAISAAGIPGDFVLVTNGLYALGETVVAGMMPNRIAVTNPVCVVSVNGPTNTVIKGQGPRGLTAVRCAYLGDGARLSGFTLTNGNTRLSGDELLEQSGGGLWCGAHTLISNCIIRNCEATADAGGALAGTFHDCTFLANRTARDAGGAMNVALYRCTVSSNSADDDGGGVLYASAQDCSIVGNTASDLGGGAAGGDVVRCRVQDNETGNDGGGVYLANVWNSVIVSNRAGRNAGGVGGGKCYHSLIRGNVAGEGGGGVWGGEAYHCTITENHAQNGGGVLDGTPVNCIIYYNTASVQGADIYDTGSPAGNHNCIGVLWPGVGNITNAPLFTDAANGHYRLQLNSPCIDSGTNGIPGIDLDGVVRPLDGKASGYAIGDMGAYEFVSTVADTDGDRQTDADEQIAGTGLRDASDFLYVNLMSRSNEFVFSWPSVMGRLYTLSRCNDLRGTWVNVAGCTDVSGVGGVQTYTANFVLTNEAFRMKVRLAP
jgi:PKD repeat protein